MTVVKQSIEGSVPRLIYSAAVLFLALYLAWLLWGRADPWERYWIGNLAVLITSLGAAFFAAWTVQRSDAVTRPAWLWLTTGLTLLAASDLLRMIALIVNPQYLFHFNLLDILFVIGMLSLAAGLLLYPRPARQSPGRTRTILDALLTSIALLALVFLLVLQPWLAQEPGSGNPVAIAYPLGDLALLLVLINLFIFSNPTQRSAPFGWITAAILAFTLSDLIYTSFLSQSVYQPGGPSDFGWVLGNLLMIAAALSQTPLQLSWGGRIAQFASRVLSRLQSLLPLLAALVLGWFVILDWRLSGTFNPPVLWVTLILALGLIGRQGILTGEVEFEQYANLVNSVAEPAFVCDGRGRFSLVNPAFIQAAGYERAGDLLGRPLDTVLNTGGESGSLIQLGRRTAQAGEQETGWSGEVKLRRKDGGLLPVFLSLRPVMPGGRDRLALAGTAHDLSLQKRQQAALQAAYEQIASDHAELERLNSALEGRVSEKTADLSAAYARLEAQNQALMQLDQLKSDFVSLVSHELRAPLTNIKSGIELLMRGTRPLSGRSTQILDLVQAEIERLTRFVETILDISALDAGRLPLYPAPLSLRGVERILKNQIAHLPGVDQVDWKIPEDVPLVLADEKALTSVLFHLLDNAFKYAPSSPVTVKAGVEGQRVWIRVSDYGPGLPEEMLPFLFERFYRSNPNDDQTVYGHGLGLYIVRRLMEAMQGEVTAENIPGSGASFICWLPRIEEGDVIEEDGSGEQGNKL
jgi:PAS domain S-box-containing protein